METLISRTATREGGFSRLLARFAAHHEHKAANIDRPISPPVYSTYVISLNNRRNFLRFQASGGEREASTEPESRAAVWTV